MSDAPPGSGNSQVLQQLLLQYAAQQQQQQQQSPRGTTQNIVLSVPVGTPRTLPRLSLSPSTAVSPGVAIVSGSTSPLALQAQALASRLSQQQQSQSYVQVSPSPLRGSQGTRVTPTSPQIIHGVPGASPPNVYMVPGSQRSLQLSAGSTFIQPQSRSPKAVTVAPAAVLAQTAAAIHGSQASPRRHPLGKVEHSRSTPLVKGHVPSPKATSKAGTRTIPSHSSSVKVTKKPPNETMSQQKPAAQPETVDIAQLTQEQIVEMREEILKQRRGILRELNVAYIERLTESFFLQRGGNMMDYLAWKKKVSNTTLNAYLTKHKLEEKTSRYNPPESSKVTSPASTPTRRKSETESRLGNGAAEASRKRTHHKAGLDAFDFNDDSEGAPPPVKVSSGFPIATKGSSQGQLNQLRVQTGARPKDPKSPLQGGSTSPVRRFLTPGTAPKLNKSPLSPGARDRLPTRQQSLSAVYDYSIGSQEMIVERAKQEAQVMQRISELRKEGLWSAKRLPKVQEPPRYKSHWDYLLDEMQWLATDFAQERRWKKAAARKLARAVAAYHRDKQAKEIKAERDEANKLRKIASNIAKEVRQFWGNIEKVVQYKQQSRLDEKRKKALDMQLDFIVGQTEKYSSWLTEGLNLSEKGSIQGSTPASTQGSLPATPEASDVEQNDEEFRPVGEDSDDDEETIDVEERAAAGEDNAKELELLQKESEEPIEDLLSKLPPPGTADPEGEGKQEKDDLKTVLNEPSEPKEEGVSTEDEEFVAEDTVEDVVDDEDTIAKEEELAGDADHKEELVDLQAEGELSMEELLKKYAGAYEEGFEVPLSSAESEMDSDDESEYEPSDEEAEAGEDDDDDDDGELKDIGMEYLLHPEKGEERGGSEKKTEDGEAGPNQEITDIAKAAESLQPKGYTLSDTQVTTKIPSLLKHSLREYQHIGLDWLVTMNDKKLNGILADEMGLGKTIQTIALLAHLACETGNWGPHLIVVPTSVMLNWEMEFKKWCPGFKILTYFGSQKERKQKRTGWTKQNAFHVCITSYKLVIQDHVSFRRKKWKYLVLDEAQNIKNFKSQRWQTLLNFNSQRRLLLTGTPLQNNLMELWSLMHFLMPHVFQSHREFREWFSNPMSGMIEGSQEYNEGLIKRLHKVLRPFLLRRLKSQVEKQLPQKYEHVVKCRLSKRQRFLYDDFMGRTKTRETLKTGQFLSVINVLMQLRKVCNHPDLFELRPSISPFVMEGIDYRTASEVTKALEYHPLKHVNLVNFNLCLADLELTLPAYIAHRTRQLQTPRRLIEEIDSIPKPPPRPPQMKMKPGKLLTPPGVAHVQREKLPLGRSSPSQQQGTPNRASPLRAASPIRSVLRATSPLMQGGRASPGATQVILRSPLGTPVPRQTTILPHGYLAGGASHQTIIPTLGGGSFALVSNPNNPGTFTIVQQPMGVPSATPLQQLPGYIATSMGPLAQQRLLQQQQQQLLSQGLQIRQQQLITGRSIPTYHQNLRGPTSPISHLGQISRGGVIQLIRPSVPLVNSTPLSPPHSVIVPGPQSPQVRTSQPLVQVIQQRSQLPLQATAQPTPHRPPQNVVQAATIGPRLSASPPVVNRTPPMTHQRTPVPAQGTTPTSIHQRSPTIAQQLLQRNLQATQGVRPVGTVAPIQLSTVTTRPQTAGTSLTPTVVSSTATLGQRSSGVAAALAGQSLSFATAPTKSSSPVTTTAKGAKADVAKKLTASGGGGIVGPSISSSRRPVVRIKLLHKADLERLKSGELFQKEAAEAEKKVRDEKRKSEFYMESLDRRLHQEHRDTLRRVARVNYRRCCAKPIYGEDLYSVVSITSTDRPATTGSDFSVGAGLVHCHCCLNGTGSVRLDAAFGHTTHLQRLLRTPVDYLEGLKEIVGRFAFVVPTVTSPGFSLSVSHPSPATVSEHKAFRSSLSRQLHRRLDFLHPLESRMKIQFPELRLIQYDCGKLQALDELLRRLKVGSHRVLIFTQMAKMLDVLERFLNFHGHIYLRLDGATKIENRQILMERFNADKRIFCFILSTRSGGVGVNLTGADTVIFYDSDWNPTMDAQAQDRCHRIGQTRDVHIYRLISEMTIEENIIKKANQKRLLADVSIDGGNFTTAFFRKTAITDLFEVDKDEQPVSKEVVKALPPPVLAAVAREEKSVSPAGLSQQDLEQALAKAEDESDVRAATMAHAERDAELAEFDESIPYEGEDPSKKEGEEGSKVEMELAQLDNQLTPIEKYAVKYMETTLEPINTEQLKEAEEKIEEAKKEWELGCLQVMTKEAEQKAEMEEDDIFFTYDREDAMNKVHNKRGASQKRPGRRPRSARSGSKGGAATRGGGSIVSGLSVDTKVTQESGVRTRSGASSPSEGPISPGPNRRSPRIRSPNHLTDAEGSKEVESGVLQNHVGNSIDGGGVTEGGDSGPVVDGEVDGPAGTASRSTRSRSRSSSSTNSSSQGLGSPPGPLSPVGVAAAKPWIITTRAQKKQKDDTHPLSPGDSTNPGIKTRHKMRPNDSGHSS